MPRRLDVATVYEVLTRLVAQDPDRRDEYLATGHSARYVVNGAPNCLVAVVLAELGCSISVLRALDRETQAPGQRKTIGVQLIKSRNPWLLRIRPEARALLASVQGWQDAGCTWAKAVANATAPEIMWLDCGVHGWNHRRETRPWMPLPADNAEDGA